MALKSTQFEPEKAEQIEENLDELDKTLDRVKVLYEQYFLGIQKQPPSYLHTDCERKIRDLTQLNIRNTAMRYRFNTLQQKFGSYNSYWRRTLRQIEQGTYARNLSKVGRKAVKSGDEIPDEILNAMPKRMREQVLRDREAAIALAKRQKLPVEGAADDFAHEEGTDPSFLTLTDTPPPSPDHDDATAFISEPSILKRERVVDKRHGGALVLDENDEFDIDGFLAAAAAEDGAGIAKTVPMDPILPTQPMPALRGTQAIPGMRTQPISPQTTQPIPGARPPIPGQATQPVPAMRTQPIPGQPPSPQTTQPIRPPGAIPAGAKPPPIPPRLPTGMLPSVHRTGPAPVVPASAVNRSVPNAPSQQAKPLPIQPGSTTTRVPVPPPQSVGGRAVVAPRDTVVTPAPAPAAPRPPPGMTNNEVDALYTKYVAAKKMVGEDVKGDAARDKLLRTIHAQAPKIMEQYKASGVDFSVVVKDNQVIIRAKPKP